MACSFIVVPFLYHMISHTCISLQYGDLAIVMDGREEEVERSFDENRGLPGYKAVSAHEDEHLRTL